MDNQQRAASTPPQTPDPSRRHIQPPSLSALAAPRTGCGVARCPALSSIICVIALSPLPLPRSLAALPPYALQWSATAWQNERCIRSMQAAHLVDCSCRTRLRRFRTRRARVSKKNGRRGALRISCCGAHIATQGQCMTLVRSCSERAGGRARPQNVIHARDEMESVRRRSRWTPRRLCGKIERRTLRRELHALQATWLGSNLAGIEKKDDLCIMYGRP